MSPPTKLFLGGFSYRPQFQTWNQLLHLKMKRCAGLNLSSYEVSPVLSDLLVRSPGTVKESPLNIVSHPPQAELVGCVRELLSQ